MNKLSCIVYLSFVVLSIAGCDGHGAGESNRCGNGLKEDKEDCDGADLGGQTCKSLGFHDGTLSCSVDCTFSTEACRAIGCGNGILEPPEECDDEDLGGMTCAKLGYQDGVLSCSVDCRIDDTLCVPLPDCGNNTREGTEECDGQDLGGQTCEQMGYAGGLLGCTGSCFFDTLGCQPLPECGDGVRNGDEQCEGADLGGQSCQSIGFDGGLLACGGDCMFDTSGCSDCGNGVIEAFEECDGSDFGSATCLSEAGHASGALSCRSDCTIDGSGCYTCGDTTLNGPEVCDSTNLDGESCASQSSHPHGTIRCGPDCLTFDVTDCNTCGNGVLEAQEICDSGNLAGESCLTITGHDSGALACETDCLSFVKTGCYTCGNGVTEGPEICDGIDLSGETCVSQTGHLEGALSCGADCLTFDSSGCYTCGNGTIEGPEQCDGAALASQTCSTQTGHLHGQLACDAGCLAFDTSGCHTCGNGIPEVFEICDDGNLQMNDSCPDGFEAGCKPAICGDGFVWNTDGGNEVCDGQNMDGRTCLSETGYQDGELLCSTDCLDFSSTDCHTCGNGIVEGPETCEDGNTIDYDGCTDCRITEFKIHTSGQNSAYPRIAMAQDASFVVVWEGKNQGWYSYIYGQRFDSSGTEDGSEFTVSTNPGSTSAISAAPDGSFVITWDRESSNCVFGQRYDVFGNPLGGNFQVNTDITNTQFRSEVSMGNDGRFVVVWEGWPNDSPRIYGRGYDPSGSPTGSVFRVDSSSYFPQEEPDVAMSPLDNSFMVVWSGKTQTGVMTIFGSRYGSSGSGLVQLNALNNLTADILFPAVSYAPDGSHVVTWATAGLEFGTSDIYTRVFDPSGNPLGIEFLTNEYTQGHQLHPRVRTAADGSFVVVWMSANQDGSSYGVFGRRFDATGFPLDPEFQVNTYTTGSQDYPDVAVAPDGRFVVVWRNSHAHGIYGQRYSSAGEPLGRLPW